MKPEAKIKRLLDKMLKAYAPYVYSVAPMTFGMGESGAPDRIVCANGVFIGIECKADAKKKLTELQLLHADRITKAGGLFFRADSKETIDYIDQRIKELLNASQSESATRTKTFCGEE